MVLFHANELDFTYNAHSWSMVVARRHSVVQQGVPMLKRWYFFNHLVFRWYGPSSAGYLDMSSAGLLFLNWSYSPAETNLEVPSNKAQHGHVGQQL